MVFVLIAKSVLDVELNLILEVAVVLETLLKFEVDKEAEMVVEAEDVVLFGLVILEVLGELGGVS